MNKKKRNKICKILEAEGFNYVLREDGEFIKEEIKDTKFHRLVEDYKKPANALEKYLDIGKWYEEKEW